MSAPASSSSRIWPMVALASLVTVLVMDCTEMGASPPTSTEPTRILRLLRRSIMRQGRTLNGGRRGRRSCVCDIGFLRPLR